MSFVFTAVIIVLIAINFPLRMQKLLRPDHVRPADRMDHVDEELAVSRNPDTIVAS
ncbi:sialic acid transporter [Cutibacterium acnes JCM 18916]|nr:sialic acid transporter [Cutibacterium acnes JCM 18916]